MHTSTAVPTDSRCLPDRLCTVRTCDQVTRRWPGLIHRGSHGPRQAQQPANHCPTEKHRADGDQRSRAVAFAVRVQRRKQVDHRSRNEPGYRPSLVSCHLSLSLSSRWWRVGHVPIEPNARARALNVAPMFPRRETHRPMFARPSSIRSFPCVPQPARRRFRAAQRTSQSLAKEILPRP